jgi:YidC/Oxa1 family membrane protein insertase
MFNYIWHTFFFDPVYNGLVFFIDIMPGGDVGLSIIATVIIVKTILLPLSIKAAKTQRVMREIEPKLKEIRETLKDKRQEQGEAMLKLYREAGISPFASIILIFLQIPIIIALYFSVYSGGGIALPAINTEILYSFVWIPELVNMNFLGLLDITGKSLLLAFLAGVTQYYQVKLAMPELPPRDPNAVPNFKEDFGRNMQLQMRYVMPVIIFFVAYYISAAIALYFFVSNLVAVLQEIYIKKHR